MRKKKKNSRLFKILFLLIVLGFVIYKILTSSLFIVKNIEVKGNIDVDNETIIKASEISLGQDNIFFDKETISKNIERLAKVEKIEINKKYPSTLVVNVEERIPAVVVPITNMYLLLDKYGIIIDTNDSLNSNLVILNGVKNIKSFYLGDSITTYANSEQNKLLINLFDGENIQKFRSIKLENDKAEMILLNDIRVAFGGYNNSKYKLDVLDVTLEAINEDTSRKVEMILMEEGPDAIVVYE